MASGGVWAPPYHSVIGILAIITDRARWHYFHGWILDRGFHLDDLTAPEFLDLAHRYIILTTENKDNAHQKIENILIGPLKTIEGETTTLVDERTGIVPPAWWHGDAEAYRNSMAAMQGMKQ